MDYEIDFLPVGDSNGDAICLRYGTRDSFWVHVVDGGFADTADTVVDHIREYYGQSVHINHMVLSHADNDHACGLVGVLKTLDVKNLWMNRPWLYAPQIIDSFHGNWTLAGLIQEIKDKHPYLVEMEAIANSRGIAINSVFAGRRIGECFTVLAPSEQRYLRLLPDLGKTPQSYENKKGFIGTVLDGTRNVLDIVREAWDIETLDDNPPATSASNETSVVQMGVFGSKRVLLTADVGPEGLREAAQYARALGLFGAPDFIQVPHHGSRRNVTPSVLNEWLGAPVLDRTTRRGVAFCSVGEHEDIYPRKKVKNAFMRRGYPVHATRGWTKRHHTGWGERPGWTVSEPEAFDPNVED
jgi:beta-lactamase superfamily II metal-dependent hydrolase